MSISIFFLGGGGGGAGLRVEFGVLGFWGLGFLGFRVQGVRASLSEDLPLVSWQRSVNARLLCFGHVPQDEAESIHEGRTRGLGFRV